MAATAMKRKGLVEDPERFQLVRYIKTLNSVRPWAHSIQQFGEVQQYGMGNSWWERTLIFATEKAHAIRDTVVEKMACLHECHSFAWA